MNVTSRSVQTCKRRSDGWIVLICWRLTLAIKKFVCVTQVDDLWLMYRWCHPVFGLSIRLCSLSWQLRCLGFICQMMSVHCLPIRVQLMHRSLLRLKVLNDFVYVCCLNNFLLLILIVEWRWRHSIHSCCRRHLVGHLHCCSFCIVNLTVPAGCHVRHCTSQAIWSAEIPWHIYIFQISAFIVYIK